MVDLVVVADATELFADDLSTCGLCRCRAVVMLVIHDFVLS